MPNVADELAVLRAKGSVRHLSNSFSAPGGATLSTPEAAAAAMKANSEDNKLGNTKAKEILNKGSNAAAQASAARAAEFAAKRKEGLEKKAQATEILNKGGSAGGYSQEMEHTLGQTGKKKAEWEKRNETKRETAGICAMVVAPQVMTPQAASTEFPSPTTVENNESASTHVGENEPASLSPVAVAKQTTPIIAISNSSIAEEEPIIADTSTIELDPAVPMEIPDDKPKPAEAENAKPKLETVEVEETESEDEGDEEYKDFLTFLKS